jgi:phospholipid/cholesterol/gamma-HCH transport system permease protein
MMVNRLGAWALDSIQEMGRMLLFVLSSFAWLVRPPLRFVQIVKQLHFVGYKSTFVVVLTAGFTGMVLALQGYYTLRKFGSEGLLGSAVALSMIRELGPVLAALMVTARAGSAMTAEIGIMRITDQIDALDTMAINPLQYLIAPKLVAGLIGVPLLVAMSSVSTAAISWESSCWAVTAGPIGTRSNRPWNGRMCMAVFSSRSVSGSL